MKVKQGYIVYVSLWIPLIWGVKVLHMSLDLINIIKLVHVHEVNLHEPVKIDKNIVLMGSLLS